MKPKRPLIGPDVRSEFLDEQLTRSVIGAFYAVYNALGYGYLESVYCAALEYALRKRGHTVDREVSVEVFYDGVAIAWYRVVPRGHACRWPALARAQIDAAAATHHAASNAEPFQVDAPPTRPDPAFRPRTRVLPSDSYKQAILAQWISTSGRFRHNQR